MKDRGQVRLGGRTFDYQVTRSHRRRKTLRITLGPDGEVRVAAPLFASAQHIHDAVSKNAAWIIARSEGPALRPPPKSLFDGESLPYLGRPVPLAVEPSSRSGPSVVFDDRRCRVEVPGALAGEARRAAIRGALVRWYQALAVEQLSARLPYWAGLAGRSPKAVIVGSQRSRWASCSPPWHAALQLAYRSPRAAADRLPRRA